MTVQHDPLVGQKLGRYLIDAPLGRGRMSTVYAATDPVIGRRVAIKALDRAVEPAIAAQFLHDAERLSQLRHPRILPIYDFGEHDGRAYLVRQQTDGGTLRAYLRESGPLAVAEALTLLRPIATALDYAHRQGFVHGNLRPSNIVRTTSGQIFLTDFAVPGQERRAGSAATTLVSAIDEPEYASPEGARDREATPGGDRYVLGTILYEVLTGQPPFQIGATGDSARNVLTRHLQAEPPAPRERNPALGPATEAVLLRALAKSPEERYPTGAALLYALGEAADLDSAAPRRPARPVTGPLGARPPRAPDSPVPTAPDTDGPTENAIPLVTTAVALLAGAEQGLSSLAGSTARLVPVHPTGRAVVAAAPAPWIIAAIGLFALLAGLGCGFLLAIW